MYLNKCRTVRPTLFKKKNIIYNKIITENTYDNSIKLIILKNKSHNLNYLQKLVRGYGKLANEFFQIFLKYNEIQGS